MSSILLRDTRAALAVLVMATGLVATSAAAQTSHHIFDDLHRYLDTGDEIYVVTKADGEVRGRVEALTATSVTVDADGSRHEIAVGDIGWIDRVPDPIWDGALGGAISGYAFSFGIAALFCAGEGGCDRRTFTDPDVHRTALMLAGVWAGTFALADAARRDRWLVYGRRPGSARGQLRQRERAPTVGELWTAVRPGDGVVVRRFDGTQLKGRFHSASSSSIRLRVADRPVEVAAAQVERVFRRTSRLREGMLIGPVVGAILGGLAPPDRNHRSDGIVGGALLGWSLGTIVGTVLPGRATVYDARPAPARVSLSPAVTREGYALRGSVRF